MKKLLARRKKAKLETAKLQAVLQDEDSRNSTPPTYIDAGPSVVLTQPFPDGVKVLHDCPNAAVDICFVHGLTGNRETTWTAHGQSTPWPTTLLPQRLKKARILTYGYDAYVVRGAAGPAGSNRLLDHATNLLNDLVSDRASCGASCRPLVIVAHSLGGLVSKEALLLSRNNSERHLREVFEHTKGIIFMGTPHRGSWMADWAKILASAIGLVKSTNKSLLDVLGTNDQYLESIQSRFSSMIREQRESGRALEVTCFFEELPLLGVGKVVSKGSATLDGYNAFSIHADHSDMVRFTSAEDNGFKRLCGELSRWELQLRKSLAFPQMQDRSYDIDRAAEGTCKWLFAHDKYRSWTGRDRGLLWIEGKPGSGKSTLLKHAWLHQRAMIDARDNELILSFFFHDRGHDLQKTPLGFFRSLLHQAISQMPSAFSNMVIEFKRKIAELGSSGDRWHWHQEELKHYFESSLPKLLEARPVWLFVDALDESGKENAVRMIRWFKSLLETLTTTKVKFHICVTCRHYPILDQEFELNICPEQENEEDISTYIQARLSGFPDLVASQVPNLITGRASGVFMWARLVVDQVLDLDNGGATVEEIRGAISSIPAELDALYERLVREMRQRPASLKLIQWVCCAIQPLWLSDLRWAMIVEADVSCPSLKDLREKGDYIDDNQKMVRRLQWLSCGLVETTHMFDGILGGVHFIHQSVKDFFLERGLASLQNELVPRIAIQKTHLQLSKICIRFLVAEEIGRSTNQLVRKVLPLPFWAYATRSWTIHASQCNEVPQDDLLKLLAWPSNAVVACWVRNYHLLHRSSRWCPGEGWNLVHVIAQNQLLGLLQAVLRAPVNASKYADSKDICGRTPLWWAARHGHAAVVQALLDMGAEIDSQDYTGHTALQEAADRGYDSVVLLLAAKGAEVDARDSAGRTTLSRAAKEGHTNVVSILKEKGAQIDAEDNEGRTPLSWAAGGGHADIVEFLVSTGAEINHWDNGGQTPLARAAEEGHSAVARMLIDRGADIDSKNSLGWTPLAEAACMGNTAVVELLLGTKRVNVDSEDWLGETPLSLAIRNQHEAVARLLLDAGATFDREAKHGNVRPMEPVTTWDDSYSSMI